MSDNWQVGLDRCKALSITAVEVEVSGSGVEIEVEVTMMCVIHTLCKNTGHTNNQGTNSVYCYFIT